jgi:hypothetical protein
MTKRQLLLIETPVPVAHVKLGSLIPKPWCPAQDVYLPPSLLKERNPYVVEDEDFFIINQSGFNNVVRRYWETTLSTHLTQVLGTNFGTSHTDTQVVNALDGKTYQLKQPENWFKEELCKRSETREWLEERMSKDDIFLVIGFRTLVDAQVKRFHKEERQKGVNVTMPVDAIISAGVTGGVPIPSSLGLDSGFAINHPSRDSERTSYTAPEEQVYAVEVRRVKFRWYSRNKVKSAFLDSNNRWVSVDVLRGKPSPEAEDNDIVEAELSGVLALPIEERVSDEEQEDEYLILAE